MSWDLFAAKIPSEWRTTEDMPHGWDPPIIGTPGELKERIKTIAPNADFSDPKWGRIVGPDYVLEIPFSRDEPVAIISFFIRGGDSAAFVAADIISGLGLQAFDTGAANGTIFPGPDVTEGLKNWRQLRDTVLESREKNTSDRLEQRAPGVDLRKLVLAVAIVAAGFALGFLILRGGF